MAGKRIVTVGAGPAGASFAISLAQAGMETILLDERDFPRPKLCGGGVTRKTRDLVIPLIGEAAYRASVKASSDEIEIRYDGKRAARFRTELAFDFVDRSLYDLAFVDAFRKASGDFRPGVRATGIDPGRHILETTAGSIGFDMLVCADGAASRMRRHFDPAYRPEGFCLEYVAPDTEGALVRIDFFSAMRGYSWSFPNGGERVIGTGSFYRKPADAAFLRTFLEVYGPVPENVHGAFIPLGGKPVLEALAEGSVHFLGDAAGFANPVTGEGLYLATKSALILSDHLSGRIRPSAYRRAMRAVGRNLAIYGKAQDLVFSPRLWSRLAEDGRPRSGYAKVCDGVISVDGDPLAFAAGHIAGKLARFAGLSRPRS